MAHEMSSPKSFEAQLYFYPIALISRVVENKKLNNVQNAAHTTSASMAAQLVKKASDTLMKSCSNSSLRVMTQVYLSFNPGVLRLQLLSQ